MHRPFGALMETLHGIDGLRKLPQGAIISIGNFDGIHLGHQRILQTAQKHASELQTSVAVVSSLIRWLISSGRARDAAICLGRPYELEGKVIEGHKRGQKIGVPTANLDCGDQLIPADGVYAGRCTHARKTYSAAISIGTLPTFGDY